MAFPDDHDRRLQRDAFNYLGLAEDLGEWVSEFNTDRQSQNNLPISDSDHFQLATLERRLANLHRSACVPVAAAVYGPSQTGKSLFVSRVVRPQEEGISPLGRDQKLGEPAYIEQLCFEHDLNPECGAHEATAIVTRFTTKDRFDETVPTTYPVLARTLSRSEWLRVLARGFLSECDLPDDVSFPQDQLEKMLEEVAKAHRDQEPAPRDVARLWQMDLLDVYSYLKQCAGSRYTAEESAFNGLMSVYPLSEEGYVEIAARLCWNSWPDLTQLFNRVCAFLDKLDRLNRAQNTPDSTEPVKRQGGILCHWAAVRFLLDSQRTPVHENENSQVYERVRIEDIVDREVDGWYVLDYEPGAGPPREDVATIQSALRELVVPVLPHRLTEEWRRVLENVDFLDIPGLLAGQGGAGSVKYKSAEKVDEQINIVKRGKVFFLFDRYIDERQAQTLLMLLRGGTLQVKGYLRGYVERWGRARYGEDNWPQRIQLDGSAPALFIGMTGIDEEFYNRSSKSALYENRLEEIVDLGKEFVHNFGGKGRRFNNIYPIRYPGTWDFNAQRRQQVGEEKWEQARRAFLESEMVQTWVADPSKKWDAAVSDNDGGATEVARLFAEGTSSIGKQDALKKEVAEVGSQLVQLGRRWLVDRDSNRDHDQRKAVAHKVLDWLTQEKRLVYLRVRALGEALCLKEGDEFRLSDAADHVEFDPGHPLPIEERFPKLLREVLDEWGAVRAPERWAEVTNSRREGGPWLEPDTFGSLTRYLAQYLNSEAVFEVLNDRLLDIARLTVADAGAKRHARRKYTRLVLNDFVMNPGPGMEVLEEVQASNGNNFGLMDAFIHRWRGRLPAALTQSAAAHSEPPPGNDDLFDLLDGFGS